MPQLLAARYAMATRFEFVLHGEDPTRLRAVAEEALDEVERIENLLSLYRPHTDIARVNTRAAQEPVRVMPETFRLLERARDLTARTEGTFDITAAPLSRVWGFMDGNGAAPDATALAIARACVGWQWVQLNSSDYSVRFLRPGVMLDLGAIGKGYALDRASDILREAGITSALLHGGTSTVVALGSPPGEESWLVGLPALPTIRTTRGGANVPLRDQSLSLSASWGKSFIDPGGQRRGHVLDPRTGMPVTDHRMAAVAMDSATDSDALSTAVLSGGNSITNRLRSEIPGIRIWLE